MPDKLSQNRAVRRDASMVRLSGNSVDSQWTLSGLSVDSGVVV
jgi:hypothetical protein